jgi:hypothetical protein
VTLLRSCGGLLMVLSAIVLALAVKVRGNTQNPFSNRDYILRCGAILGLMLGFILIEYSPH